MKEGWEFLTIKDISTVTAGQSPEGKYYNACGNGLPFYQGKKDFGEKYVKPSGVWTSVITKIAVAGDILMSVRAPVGPVNIATEEICIGRGLASIRPNHKVNRDYVYYFFQHYQSKLVGNTGAVFDSINKSQIESFPILVPPLPEQQRIVSIIDKAFEAIDQAIANTQKNLDNAKELFESYLNSVFENGGEDWVNKRLQDVAFAFGRGKSKHRPRNWEGLFNGIYPFIQTGEVRNANKYIETYEKSYNDVGLAQSKLWLKGTICITIAANIAETAILAIDACIPDSIIGLQTDPQKANLDFTYYLLQHYRTELQKLGKGSAQDNLNLGSFDNLYFPFPSVKEQIEIVSKLDALMAESEQLQIIYRQKLLDLEELKKSILNKAFAGEL